MTARAGKAARIAPTRKLVQWLSTLLLLGIPFLRLGGESLLRLDAATRTLHLFGASIRIEEFYLFLLAVLILVFLFLLVATLFGRVWCGWLCPQTTLCDLAEWVDAKCRSLIPTPLLAATLSKLFQPLLACLVACNLVWFFIAPAPFFARLFSGEIGPVAGCSLLATFLLVYLDLALVRRSFCKTVCPYGRMQLLTMEPGTLTLEFDPQRKDACLRCGACLGSCPMGIDIREGLQIECINCGRCLDACRDVMERRGGTGLIALLAVGLGTRSEATLKVQRAAGGEVKLLSDGSLVNFYAIYLENRATRPGTYALEVAPLPGYRLELIGPVRELRLAANANRKVDLALRVSPAPPRAAKLELRLMQGSRSVAKATLPLLTQ